VSAGAAAGVGAIVLAAGSSARLGRPKQLLPLAGRPLLQHALDAAGASGLAEIVVVLGHAAEEVSAAIRLPPGARTLANPEHAEGQSTSLRAGLGALGPGAGAALVLLGDQPTVSSAAIRAVAGAWRPDGPPIIQARYDGRPGHPVLLARSVWPELMAIAGDRGARELIARHPARVGAVELPGPPPPDLDTWADYERLRAEVEAPPGAGAASL
jgi:molybdenum cofactor cytidylyltransferase